LDTLKEHDQGRRRHPRARISSTAVLAARGGRTVSGTFLVENLSAGGALLVGSGRESGLFPVGASVELHLQLPGSDPIDVSATVVRAGPREAEGQSLAVQFRELRFETQEFLKRTVLRAMQEAARPELKLDGAPELQASSVPSRLPCDLKTLPLRTVDAFVLSQIDGRTSIDELASLVALPLGEAGRIVLRLHELGAIELPGRPRPRPPEKAPPPPPRRPSGRLRSLLSQRVEKAERAARQHASVFVLAAEEALAKNDFVASEAHYKLALAVCDAPDIRAALEAVEGKARAKKLETNLPRAEKAEREQRWADAVTYYTKAYSALPEPRVAERLANALRLEGSDLRRAVKHAEEAVLAEPRSAAFRVTLAEVYAHVGLNRRARAEAERALSLSPKEGRAAALIAKLGR
jgi:tetratricopeptide (TPR) repeat protein